MSHVATIDLVIEDLDALAKACDELGLELRRGQTSFKWFGQWVNDYDANNAAYRNGISTDDYGRCEHAIAVKGNDQAYEIGLVKAADGRGYKLVFDFFAGGYGLMEKVGNDCDKLRQEYAVSKATITAHKQGYRVLRAPQPDGKIKLTLTR